MKNKEKKNSKLTSKDLQKILDNVGDEIDNVLDKVNENSTKKLINKIVKSKKIFLYGGGRSGLIAEAFAMRLTQLGLESHVIGESSAPKIKKNNLLILISGSGETKITNEIAIIAKKAKAKIILITANKDSSIAKKSNLIIKIEAKTKTKGKSLEPLGSLFEQTALIYLDSIILILMNKLNKTEKQMKKRHSSIS
jgi:6-phospho-3-hexuloisomerase